MGKCRLLQSRNCDLLCMLFRKNIFTEVTVNGSGGSQRHFLPQLTIVKRRLEVMKEMRRDPENQGLRTSKWIRALLWCMASRVGGDRPGHPLDLLPDSLSADSKISEICSFLFFRSLWLFLGSFPSSPSP